MLFETAERVVADLEDKNNPSSFCSVASSAASLSLLLFPVDERMEGNFPFRAVVDLWQCRKDNL